MARASQCASEQQNSIVDCSNISSIYQYCLSSSSPQELLSDYTRTVTGGVHFNYDPANWLCQLLSSTLSDKTDEVELLITLLREHHHLSCDISNPEQVTCTYIEDE